MNADPRKNIPHLQKLSDRRFLEMMNDAPPFLTGPCTMKIDGFSARFGADFRGEVYLESGKSGPIFEVGAFQAFAEKNGRDVTRAAFYDEILLTLKGLSHLIPVESKIFCEMLYYPMASQEWGDTKLFVNTPYYTANLKKLTIFPYQSFISGRERCSVLLPIVECLRLGDYDDIKVIMPHLDISMVDLFDLKRELKKDTVDISRVKEELAERILSRAMPMLLKFTPIPEGVVVQMPETKRRFIAGEIKFDGTFKVVTPEFKEIITQRKLNKND